MRCPNLATILVTEIATYEGPLGDPKQIEHPHYVCANHVVDQIERLHRYRISTLDQPYHACSGMRD